MSEILWNLRDKRGRIYGPLSTQKIEELIRRGYLDGEELITPFATERWVPISKYPEFYDVILEALQSESKKMSPDEISQELSISQGGSNKKEKTDGSSRSSEEFTGPRKRGRVVIEQDETEKKKGTAENFATVKEDLGKKENIIELKEEGSFKKDERRKYFFYLLATLVVIGVFVYLFSDELLDSVPTNQEKVHLIFPSRHKSALPLSETQEMLKKALNEFQRDGFRGYYHSEEILTDLLESNPKNLDAISLLCLTYRELWPYSYQDSQDLQNLTKLVQMAQGENALGIHGATCRAVQTAITAENSAINSVLQTLLNDYPTAAVLYEMKAQVLFSEGKTSEAIAYVQKTEGLWPQWLKPFFLEAEMRIVAKDFYNAAKMLKDILQKNPKHNKSQVELGILELTQFHDEKGLDRLLLGLEDKKLPSSVIVNGYIALTNYYISSQPQKALEYAQKAYGLDPRNTFLRNTILSLGGEAALSKVKSEDSQLVVLGDSYFKNKNYLAAQAQYKTAFETNPKNAMAALKAAQSLWGMNQTKEAIDWALKAAKADPKLVEAYVQLADYYSQKYDFKAASEYLTKARAESKLNYQILRAYAQVEIRRKSPQTAQQYAEDALKMYDSDVESLNILSESLMAQNHFEKAYQYAAKAVSLDANNSRAQEVYAESLFGMRGIEAAQDYLNNLINTYPNNLDYKTSLGQIYLKDQRYNQAATVLAQVTDADPNLMRPWMLLGQAYLQQNLLNDALKVYVKAASLDPSSAEPLFQIGQTYLRNKDTVDKALNHFERVIEINPYYPRAYYFAGKAGLLLGQTKKAEQFAEMEKKVNPEIADPYILLSDIHFSQNQYSQAATELRKAVAIRPDDATLYIQLAKCYRLSGQLDVAASMLRVAMAKESGNPDIYREQGAVFERQGLSDQALAAYDRYLQLKPNAEDRSEVQSRIQKLGGSQ